MVKIHDGDDSIIADAYCDNCNGGGGWLVVQRRQDGSVDFNRGWGEYENGFGNLTGEFWYGLKALHCLTGQGGWEMKMDIKLANGTNLFLQYEQFEVASANDKYKLTVRGYEGNTTKHPVADSDGEYFTTRDRDNDDWGGSCVQFFNGAGGGWWFDRCGGIGPNGPYNQTRGIILIGKGKGYEWHSLPFIEIKIRPRNCKI